MKDSDILLRAAAENKGNSSAEPEATTSPPKGPIAAWASPEHPLRFQLDLSFPDDCAADERDMNGTVGVQLKRLGGATPAGKRANNNAPPLTKTPAYIDLNGEWSILKKAQSPIAQLVSPRRTQSPLRRFNKVAPLEPRPKLSTQDDSNKLRCKSESSLYEAIPLAGRENDSSGTPDKTTRLPPPPPLPPSRAIPPPSPSPPLPPFEPTVIVVETSKFGKANENKENERPQAAEPIYSRVSKIKGLSHSLEDVVERRSQDCVTAYSSEEQLLCDDQTDPGYARINPCYQSEDSRLALTYSNEYNHGTAQEGDEEERVTRKGRHVTNGDVHVNPDRYANKEEGSHMIPKLELEQEVTPPASDLEIDTASTVTSDPAVSKLPDRAPARSHKKHNDDGSVRLLSVRGMANLPESRPLYFPAGASVDMVSIHYAAATGNKEVLEGFLSSLPVVQDPVEMVLGSDRLCKLEGVDVGDSEGRTPLMHAAHGNHLQCVQLLVGVGASVNCTAKDGSTALHDAAYSGSAEMVALLLSLGAQGMQRDNQGRTPLHWATNNTDSRCISILLDRVPGLHVDDRDIANMTPLMWAAYHRKPDVIKALLEKGADQFLTDLDGMCAVHWAVQRHDTRALQVLINYESSKCKDNRGRTVMHLAAEQGCARATCLIKAIRPPSVDDLDNNWRTPLHWAVVCENPEVIRALLASGASQSVCDSSGRTALNYAIERGYHYCALLLSQAASSNQPELGSYQSYLDYNQIETSAGERALQCQQGQPISAQDLESALTRERVFYIQAISTGSWINKFTNDAKGPLHPRFFVVDPSRMLISWYGSMKSPKDIRSDVLVGIRSSASPAVVNRKDFDPLHKHKYAFTIFTRSRILDVVALSSEDFKIWLSGIQVLVHLGPVNAMKALATVS